MSQIMSSKKNRYSSSLSPTWIIPPIASRPTSLRSPQDPSSDTPDPQNRRECRRPSTSGTSCSKYTSSFPSTWRVSPSRFDPVEETPSKIDNRPNRTSSDAKKHQSVAALEIEPYLADQYTVAIPTAPRAPVEERFPNNRQFHFTSITNAARKKYHDQTALNRPGASPPAAPRPSNATLSTLSAISSTCSPSGSCDLPVKIPSISPSYSVV